MALKSDKWIRRMANEFGMITPFESQLLRQAGDRRIISAGLSSYGYDIRLAPDGFRVFSPVTGIEIDPKNFDQLSLVEVPLRSAADGASYWLMPPHSYALGVTVETFKIPRSVIGICMGKSTYARSGIIVNTTPLEPGWRGRLVLELSNSADLPARVYCNEGVGQILFFEADEECEVSYEERAGKYQDQMGIVTPIL